MKKTAIKALFNTYSSAADAMGIRPQAITNWSQTLSDRQRNEVIGAAIYAGILRVVPTSQTQADALGLSMPDKSNYQDTGSK